MDPTKEIVKELKFDPQNPEYVYITTVEEANKAIDDLEKEKALGVDVESNSLDPFQTMLLTIQIGNDHKTWIFDARLLNLREIPRFKSLLENPQIIKILHNGKFDYKQIKMTTGIEMANLYDTMLTESILNAGLGAGYYKLKDLAMKYANYNMSKEIRETFITMSKNSRLTDDQLKYGAIDTLIMFPIFEAQLQQLSKHKLFEYCQA